MQTKKQKQPNPRDGGDDALANLDATQDVNTTPADNVGYSNEERIAEEGDGVNMPEEPQDDPSSSGIASKE
ncbi:MAG TPA: hypothetical protein PL009_08260 [Flavipsychrobacter sp.]|nr:hypothetical protein [Flavipsychrobacter sp.]